VHRAYNNVLPNLARDCARTNPHLFASAGELRLQLLDTLLQLRVLAVPREVLHVNAFY
jgi:hypothetical protein